MNGLNIIVIGAGIVGSSVAREAAARGASVRVLEAETPAAGASGAAAGALHPLTGMRLSVRPERFEGFHLTRQWLEEDDETCFSTPGILRLVTKEQQADLWLERIEDVDPNIAYWQGPDELFEQRPQLSSDILGGVFIPEGTFVDVPRWIRSNLSRPGIELIPRTRVARVDESAEGAWLQTESGMTMSADKIVVAAGLHTRQPLVDVDLDWIPYKGELGVFAGIESPRVALNYRGYIAPWNDNQVLLGVLNTRAPFEEGVREELAQELLSQMSEVWTVDTTDARMVDSWSGIRPALTNHKPRLGPISSTERVFICTGHGGRGLLTAPLSAVALCDRMDDRAPSVPNSWLLDG